MFFSPSLNIFVNPALKDDYINVNSWPDDAVEVDEQVYIEFSGLPPKGKIRIA
ncbi:TPA: tail fiber assembly protein, partial [Escherichia coli]|nr:tail fiber assembly protein [Escherichia coli]